MRGERCSREFPVPIHMAWPCIRGRVAAGDLILPHITPDNFYRALNGTMAALGFDQGGLYSPHGFRRWAPNEIKNSGATLATIVKSGTRLSDCYKNYLGLQADEAVNISTLLLDSLGYVREEEDIDKKQKRRPLSKTIRNRMRKIPITFRNDMTTDGDPKSDSGTSLLWP